MGHGCLVPRPIGFSCKQIRPENVCPRMWGCRERGGTPSHRKFPFFFCSSPRGRREVSRPAARRSLKWLSPSMDAFERHPIPAGWYRSDSNFVGAHFPRIWERWMTPTVPTGFYREFNVSIVRFNEPFCGPSINVPTIRPPATFFFPNHVRL